MAGQIEALMGMVPPEQADQQALARQLRSDRNLGQFMGFSGNQQVQKQGQQMVSDALSGAKGAGTRREQALGRSIAAEKEQYSRGRDTKQDIIAADALEQSLKGYDGIEEYTDAEGKNVLYGTNKSTGVFEEVPDTEGLTPYDKYAARGPTGKQNYKYTVQGSNEEAFANPTTRKVWFPRTGKMYDSIADLEIQEGIKLRASGAEAEAYAKKHGADSAEGDVARTEAAYESVDETGSLIGDLEAMYDVVKNANPSTSKFSQYFPTFFGDTAYFESVKDRMALNNLKKWKLTPVSDKDLKYLLSATMPDLPRDQMIPLVEHRLEAMKKLQMIQEIEADWLAEKGGKRPTRAERAAMKEEIDAAIGGFDFGKFTDVYKGGETEAIQSRDDAPPKVDTVEAAPQVGVYPAWVTTPEAQAAWDRKAGGAQ